MIHLHSTHYKLCKIESTFFDSIKITLTNYNFYAKKALKLKCDGIKLSIRLLKHSRVR